MPKGYVPENEVTHGDTPLDIVFKGTTVNRADVQALKAAGIITAQQFADLESDSDLTVAGVAGSLRDKVVPIFEESEWADLLDYAPVTGAPSEPAAATTTTTSTNVGWFTRFARGLAS